MKKLQKYDSGVINFWWFFISFWIYLPIALYVGIDDLSFWPYSMAAGLVYCVAFIFYTEGLKRAEVSMVAPLYNFNAVFLLLLAVLILGESFSWFKVGGILLLLFGASFLASGKNFWDSYRVLLRNKGALFMLGCSLLIAVGRIVDGFVVQSVKPVVYGLSLEFFLSVYLLIYIGMRRKLPEIKRMVKERTKLTAALGVFNGLSYLFLLIAFTRIEVSVAEPMTMLGAIVSIIFAKFLFGEKIKSRLVGAVVMVVGAWLLFM